MIDLTPLEVRKKKGDFKKALRGYEPALVDDFLDLVADRLDQLVRENNAMTERLQRAEHQVADNRERERALTDALVTAQEMREEMRQQTTREADLMRRTAEQQVAQMRSTAEQEAAAMRSAAEQESVRMRTDALQAREREEEAVRRLRARQRQLLQSFRTFLSREMAELQVIGETLEIESMAPAEPPRAEPAKAPRATTGARTRGERARADIAPPHIAHDIASEEIMPAYIASEEIALEEIAPEEIAPEDIAPEETAHIAQQSAPPAALAASVIAAETAVGMMAPPEEPGFEHEDMRMTEEPVEEIDLRSAPAAELAELDIFGHSDEPIDDDAVTLDEPEDDLLHHATVMGALEIAILEDDEPFAPEPVEDDDLELALEEFDDQEDVEDEDDNLAPHDAYADADELAVHRLVGRTEVEPEIGAPDHDATVLLENALKAGYRIDLDDDDDDLDELLLEDDLDDEDADGDAEPPQGWLDTMIDDEK
jgi:DivIVA domain-containing protein